MADKPKHPPMDLRTAVEIDRNPKYCMHVFIVTPAGISREQAEALMKKKREGKYRAKERARAIVDAAVEAHEARCYLDDYEGGDRPERLLRVEACFESLAKLRALERGEDA